MYNFDKIVDRSHSGAYKYDRLKQIFSNTAETRITEICSNTETRTIFTTTHCTKNKQRENYIRTINCTRRASIFKCSTESIHIIISRIDSYTVIGNFHTKIISRLSNFLNFGIDTNIRKFCIRSDNTFAINSSTGINHLSGLLKCLTIFLEIKITTKHIIPTITPKKNKIFCSSRTSETLHCCSCIANSRSNCYRIL